MKMMDKAIERARILGIKQGEFARAIGTYPTRVSEWKNDNGKPSVQQALAMARLLRVDLESLVDDEMELIADEEGPRPRLTEAEQRLLWLAELVGMETAMRRIAQGEPARQYVPAFSSGGGGDAGELTADDDRADEPRPARKEDPPRIVALQDTTEALRREIREKERPKRVEPKGKPKGQKGDDPGKKS